MTLDTLSWTRRFTEAGFTEQQAVALAEVSRDIAIAELVTRSFLHAELDRLLNRLTIRLAIIATLAVGALASLLRP